MMNGKKDFFLLFISLNLLLNKLLLHRNKLNIRDLFIRQIQIIF